MRKRKLPTGIQTFRKIREEGGYYVDKTAYIRRLVAEGTHYFLSRPRRFGKSLLLDTVKELFEGNEALFAGLHIHKRWDWSVRHPVVRLDFSGGDYLDSDWQVEDLIPQIASIERAAGVTPVNASARARLRHLLIELHERTRTLPVRGSTPPWRRAPARAAWTWPCACPPGSTCSSSRWWRTRATARRCGS